MTRDLNCTDFQATIGFSVFPLGFAVTPLFTAPLSEEFGRRPLHLVSIAGFGAMHVLVAVYDVLQHLPGSVLTGLINLQSQRYRHCYHCAASGWRIWFNRCNDGGRNNC